MAWAATKSSRGTYVRVRARARVRVRARARV
jgi:hypothetical protein